MDSAREEGLFLKKKRIRIYESKSQADCENEQIDTAWYNHYAHVLVMLASQILASKKCKHMFSS